MKLKDHLEAQKTTIDLWIRNTLIPHFGDAIVEHPELLDPYLASRKIKFTYSQVDEMLYLFLNDKVIGSRLLPKTDAMLLFPHVFTGMPL